MKETEQASLYHIPQRKRETKMTKPKLKRRKRKLNYIPCVCEAYPFPHRPDSGACADFDPGFDEQAEHIAWLEGERRRHVNAEVRAIKRQLSMQTDF